VDEIEVKTVKCEPVIDAPGAGMCFIFSICSSVLPFRNQDASMAIVLSKIEAKFLQWLTKCLSKFYEF